MEIIKYYPDGGWLLLVVCAWSNGNHTIVRD